MVLGEQRFVLEFLGSGELGSKAQWSKVLGKKVVLPCHWVPGG